MRIGGNWIVPQWKVVAMISGKVLETHHDTRLAGRPTVAVTKKTSGKDPLFRTAEVIETRGKSKADGWPILVVRTRRAVEEALLLSGPAETVETLGDITAIGRARTTGASELPGVAVTTRRARSAGTL